MVMYNCGIILKNNNSINNHKWPRDNNDNNEAHIDTQAKKYFGV